MAITSKDGNSYGDSRDDLHEELRRYSRTTGYPLDHLADAVCTCGHDLFELHTDDVEGVAGRVCARCGDQHLMADGEDYVDGAELGQCVCLCGAETFEISAAVHVYRDADGPSDDVRWLYIGCRCPACGLVGCYADWKNEAGDYRELLAKT